MPYYLVQLQEGVFHPFPGSTISQDQNLQVFTRHRAKWVKWPQQDGSIFRSIPSKLSAEDTLHKLFPVSYQRPDVWTETILDMVRLKEIFKRDTEEKRGNLKYVAYWLHTFLNGRRYYPLVINPDLRTFYDVSFMFEYLSPADDFGVLVEDNFQKLGIESLGLPEVIEYQSYIRLCHTCGNVSDVSKPLLDPWMAYKRKVSNKEAYLERADISSSE